MLRHAKYICGRCYHQNVQKTATLGACVLRTNNKTTLNSWTCFQPSQAQYNLRVFLLVSFLAFNEVCACTLPSSNHFQIIVVCIKFSSWLSPVAAFSTELWTQMHKTNCRMNITVLVPITSDLCYYVHSSICILGTIFDMPKFYKRNSILCNLSPFREFAADFINIVLWISSKPHRRLRFAISNSCHRPDLIGLLRPISTIPRNWMEIIRSACFQNRNREYFS